MRLSQTALDKIKDKRIRRKLAEVLDVTDGAIKNYIRRNDDKLTKYAVIKVIREETGMVDEEILEMSTA